jgi:uncharacterized membrane protein YfcA
MLFDGVEIVALIMASILIAVVAFFYSNLGLGGGQLYVPIMVLTFPAALFGMKEIVPLSLCFAFATMAMATYSHNRKKLVNVKIALVLALFGLIGVGAGVLFTSVLPDWAVKASFAAMLVIVATKMIHDIYRKRKDYATCPATFSLSCWLTGTGVSILTGFLIGSFGVGGGVLSVPLIIYVYKVPTRMAIGTSALMGAVLTPAAFAAYALNATGGITIHWQLAAVLTPVVFVMALIGSTWGLEKLKTNLVRTIFTIGVYLAAAAMVFNLLTSLGS